MTGLQFPSTWNFSVLSLTVQTSQQSKFNFKGNIDYISSTCNNMHHLYFTFGNFLKDAEVRILIHNNK
jgi:hypothetical protein